MLKVSENPPIVWPKESSIRDFTGCWLVAHTKSRNEKALANDLVRKGINYFLPMSWNVRRQSGRTIRSLLPLFGGYLFFCGGENERLELLRTNRVANLIEVKDQLKFVGELLQIEQALVGGASLRPHRYIKKGQLCRVIAGPLANMEGVVERQLNIIQPSVAGRSKKGNITRVVLNIEILGQAVSAEIDDDMIEIIDEIEN